MDFKLTKNNLNFRVWTAETIPTTPGKENDVVVLSPVPMKNWMLSTNAPKGTPRSDGDVWLQYSVDGTAFNALKNAALVIAVSSAYQYINGEWLKTDVRIYQDGAWVECATYLFNNGDTCDSITGGWSNSGYSYTGTVDGSSKTYTNTSPTIGETIEVAVGKELKVAIAGTANKINLSDVKTIAVDVDTVVSQAFIRVCSTKAINSNPEASLSLGSSATATTTKTLDVSSLSGSYYIAIFTYGSTSASSGRSATIKKVWLVK